MQVSIRRRVGILAGALCLAAAGAVSQHAEARMTIVYDVPESFEALVGVQSDGSPGLNVADGLYQQLTLGPLPADRRVNAVTGGIGTAATPTIGGLPASSIAALLREQIDLAGARMVFIDIGSDYDMAGADAENLDAAMTTLAATPFAGGGSYADRVHMYVARIAEISDPQSRAAFWHAMSLSGGIWLEAYSGRESWPTEHWLAWPRALRDGLVARGMHPTRLHMIVRGTDQAAVWANMRVGVACEFLANGPGAYRIEDHLGFVREFRATFGTAPAPPGPSPVACNPAPVLPEPRATSLADVLALEATGASLSSGGLSATRLRTRTPKRLRVSLGADPLGIAAKLAANPATFWAAARARITATGAGLRTSARLSAAGSTILEITPTSDGPIALGLTVDGAAIRQAIGPPVDLALSLAAHKARIAPVLGRAISRPIIWELAIPLRSRLKAGPPLPTLSIRVLRRRAAPRPSIVELRLSRPWRRLLVEVVVLKKRRHVVVRRLRISGIRAVVPVRLPRGLPVGSRVIPE
jgi:hypothetical protein